MRYTNARNVAVAATAFWLTGCGDGGDPVSPPPPPPPPVPTATQVVVSPAEVRLEALGATVQLSAAVRDQNGQAMTAAVTWASSDAAVATVGADGLVTAVDNGMATITATAGGVSGSAAVTVAQEVSAVAVSPAANTLAVGDMLQLTAEAADANGNRVGDAAFSWESGDADVATVDADGLVTAVGNGTATITATAGGVSGSATVTVANLDRAALIALFEATDGPNWFRNRNWLTDAPLGDWYGVHTDASGRVTRLYLTGNDLSGPIPPELGNLGDLEILDLAANDLSGPVPPELGNLGELVDLDLYYNALSGPIPPELGNLGELVDLDLGHNDLSGPIPPELGNLGELNLLDLYENALSGPIPPELGNLGDLEVLSLSGNALSGPIPPELGNLGELDHLSLRENALSGPIPPELGNLGELNLLNLSGNALSGPIPPELGNLASLEYLILNNNKLTDPLPQSFLNINGLSTFSIGENEGLCVPATDAFITWLRAIAGSREDESAILCNTAASTAPRTLSSTRPSSTPVRGDEELLWGNAAGERGR